MMKRTSISLMALALAAAGSLPLPANAQQTAAPPAATEKDTPPPAGSQDWSPAGGSVQVKTSDSGIRYASGGVGAGERDELRAMANQFNLQIMSAMQGGGEYLADMGIRIMDSKGATVLSATSKGPYFLAELPPGSYTVEVSAKDKTQKQSAQIGKSQVQLNFYWR